MEKPKVLVLAGYGLNCEEETAYAFNLAGGEAEVVHVNDFFRRSKKDFFPMGFKLILYLFGLFLID